MPVLNRPGEEATQHFGRQAELSDRQGQVGGLLQQHFIIGLQLDGGAELGQSRLELALLQELFSAIDELGGVSHGCLRF